MLRAALAGRFGPMTQAVGVLLALALVAGVLASRRITRGWSRSRLM